MFAKMKSSKLSFSRGSNTVVLPRWLIMVIVPLYKELPEALANIVF